jgi:Uma2 family endonuclease
MAVQKSLWQFTVADYAHMRQAGILAEDDRVELIDGEVRAMTPIGPLHVSIVNRLTALLNRRVGEAAIVSVQNPIQLTDYSEPQPDLAVLRPRADYYAHAHPTPADVLLVIEVADTSAAYDRGEKIPRYAAAGIPEVWLVDSEAELVECYSQPVQGRYRLMRTVGRGEEVVAQTLDTLHLDVASIFGAEAG